MKLQQFGRIHSEFKLGCGHAASLDLLRLLRLFIILPDIITSLSVPGTPKYWRTVKSSTGPGRLVPETWEIREAVLGRPPYLLVWWSTACFHFSMHSLFAILHSLTNAIG